MTRVFVVISFLLVGSLGLWAQPGNDDCDGLIDLGTVPFCSDPGEFTNVDATPSNIATMNNAPGCFNGGQVDRDVWFSFTLPADITDISIIINGDEAGGNSIINPQVALYRGICEFDRLNLLACASSSLGSTSIRLDMVGLVPSATYFLRINDYSINTMPNAGDFQVCVTDLISIYNIGQGIDRSSSCEGTLYDSGGPDEEYDVDEDFTFTICPSDFHRCIRMSLAQIALEPNFDIISIYEGDGTDGTLLARTSVTEDLNSFIISSETGCVTVQFQSDGSVTAEGFELNWECLQDECEGSTLLDPENIDIPGSYSGSTCDDFPSLGEDFCAPEGSFLGGPDYVYTYTAQNEVCLSIEVNASVEGTGLAILSGNPDGSFNCEAVSGSGFLESVQLDSGLVYYFVIANDAGCFDFDIAFSLSDVCNLEPSLDNALCRPLNSCFTSSSDSLRRRFVFSSSVFADLNIVEGVNSGCWAQDIIPPDQVDNTNFYWFTLRAYAEGNIGFFVESVEPSDIDFNVWGPFTDELVCENPDSVRSFIESNQPIRSSWTGGAIPTGLADIHPVTGIPVFDEYDCDFPITGAGGDGIVRTIQAQEGENYVFLFNDFGEQVDERGLIVDWSGMDANTIFADGSADFMNLDTTLCPGDQLDLAFLESEYPIFINPQVGLSCNNCFDPVITPQSNYSEYKVFFGGACYVDTLELTIAVLEDFGNDTIFSCNNQIIELDVEVPGDDVTYSWTGDNLSCADCPNPIFQTTQAGDYLLVYTVEIDRCQASGSFLIIVDENEGPEYDILSDTTVCEGAELSLGGMDFSGTVYEWSIDGEIISDMANPMLRVDSSFVAVLNVSNTDCPYNIVDSVVVTMIELPDIDLVAELDACEGDTIQLSNLPDQDGVTYNWTTAGGTMSLDPGSANSSFVVGSSSGLIILTAERGDCEVRDTTDLNVTPIDVEISPNMDTLYLCLGDSFDISSSFRPQTSNPIWIRFDTGDTLTTENISGEARNSFKLYRELENGMCFARDSIYVQVDSLPDDLSIMPQDTTVCEGSYVILTSPSFNTARYNMEYLWIPSDFLQTGDSLYNAVSQPTDTITYQRISRSGACVDTAEVTINVNKTPIVTLVPEKDTLCLGESTVINATVDPEDADIEWVNGSGLSCDDCLDPTVSPQSTSTYTLEADNNGCPGSGSVTITVINDSGPEFDPPADLVVCEGELIALNPNANPNYEYEWSSADPDFMDQDTRNPVIMPPVGLTRYSVTVTDGSGEFCSSSEHSFNVLVPVLGPLDDIPYCIENDLYSLNASLVNAPDEIIGNNDIVWSNGFTGPNIQVRPIDLISSELTATLNIDDCVSSSSMFFVQLSLSVDLISNIDTGSSIFISTSTSHDLEIMFDDIDDIESIQWINATTNELIGEGENITINHDDPSDTLFRVRVLTVNGCEQTITFRYEIIDLSLPNAFSPNNDGINDRFNIIAENIDNSPFVIEEFKIFSRWGSLVYDNDTPIEGWDGTDGSNPLPTDSYKYIIKIRTDDSLLERQGEINLIR